MDFLGKTILPALLIAGASYLALIEFSSFPRLKNAGYPEKLLKIRLVRRIAGLALVVAIAVMMYWGLNHMPGPVRGSFHRQAFHWAVVMGMVFIVVLLALWDAVDGLRYLESIADQFTKQDLDELDGLQEKLKKEKALFLAEKEIRRPGP